MHASHDEASFEYHVKGELSRLRYENAQHLEMTTACLHEVVLLRNTVRSQSGLSGNLSRRFSSGSRRPRTSLTSTKSRAVAGELDAPATFPSEGEADIPSVSFKNIAIRKSGCSHNSDNSALVGHSGEHGGRPRTRVSHTLRMPSTNVTLTYRKRVAKAVWRFLEDKDSSYPAKAYYYMVSCLNVMCIASAFLQLDESVSLYSRAQVGIEIVFFAELVARLLSCPQFHILLMNAVFNLIDAVAVIPLLLRIGAWCSGVSYSETFFFVRICFPTILALKMLRRFEKLQLVSRAFLSALDALPVMLFTLFLIAFIFAAALYLCEPRSNVETISHAMWLTLVTMSTVGYGDVYPETQLGRWVTTILIVVSGLYMAIPIGIVGNAFSTVWEDRDRLLLLHRLREGITRSGYSADEFCSFFFHIDQDGDGMLSFVEFLHMLKEMDINVPDALAYQVYETFDDDLDGTLDFSELMHGVFPNHRFKTPEAPTNADDTILDADADEASNDPENISTDVEDSVWT
eukprot:TRINITY_DN18301_c0_g2_i1.p1 TRINITY_DN18301_c0_g2~~TRINITY_DN18301_c0_g2_i1.p1  ORF type:complete len:516 (+),score=47.11 TRINITY_DN18301_c0_g2_i1:111-1658(+)